MLRQVDSSLFVDREESESLLSYAVLDIDPIDRIARLDEYDINKDGKLNRVECAFPQLNSRPFLSFFTWAHDVRCPSVISL